jgi:hypothetical protein
MVTLISTLCPTFAARTCRRRLQLPAEVPPLEVQRHVRQADQQRNGYPQHVQRQLHYDVALEGEQDNDGEPLS